MNNLLSVVVILGLIVIGATVIQLINGHRRDGIATQCYGRTAWNPRHRPAPPDDDTRAHPTDADTDPRHGHYWHRLRARARGRPHDVSHDAGHGVGRGRGNGIPHGPTESDTGA
ncbi:hypothetical protein ACWEJP_17845 [Streptomyces sp. NPDC004749]